VSTNGRSAEADDRQWPCPGHQLLHRPLRVTCWHHSSSNNTIIQTTRPTTQQSADAVARLAVLAYVGMLHSPCHQQQGAGQVLHKARLIHNIPSLYQHGQQMVATSWISATTHLLETTPSPLGKDQCTFSATCRNVQHVSEGYSNRKTVLQKRFGSSTKVIISFIALSSNPEIVTHHFVG